MIFFSLINCPSYCSLLLINFLYKRCHIIYMSYHIHVMKNIYPTGSHYHWFIGTAPSTQGINSTYIRRSKDVLKIFWTSYVRSIYVLCQGSRALRADSVQFPSQLQSAESVHKVSQVKILRWWISCIHIHVISMSHLLHGYHRTSHIAPCIFFSMKINNHWSVEVRTSKVKHQMLHETLIYIYIRLYQSRWIGRQMSR